MVNIFTLKGHREGQDLGRTKNDYRDAVMVVELLPTDKFTFSRLTYGSWADVPYRIRVGVAHFRPLGKLGGQYLTGLRHLPGGHLYELVQARVKQWLVVKVVSQPTDKVSPRKFA